MKAMLWFFGFLGILIYCSGRLKSFLLKIECKAELEKLLSASILILTWIRRRLIEIGALFAFLYIFTIFEEAGYFPFLHFETADSIRVASGLWIGLYWVTLWREGAIWIAMIGLFIFITVIALAAGALFMSLNWQTMISLISPLSAIPVARRIRKHHEINRSARRVKREMSVVQ